MAAFTYRSARSSGIIIAIGTVLIVETVAMHAIIMRTHPRAAWVLTLSSLSALLWLIADYRAMGGGAVNVSPTDIDIRIGKRFSTVIPRASVVNAIRPTFRDLPQVISGAGKDYLNLMKHTDPNVLLTLHEPAVVSLAGMKLRARQISMHLDDPDGFLTALKA